jgi:hypothetical protein
MPLLKALAAALLALAATVLALRALNPLPSLEPRQASSALTDGRADPPRARRPAPHRRPPGP